MAPGSFCRVVETLVSRTTQPFGLNRRRTTTRISGRAGQNNPLVVVSPSCCSRVIDHDDWHARYTAVDIIITTTPATTPLTTECAAELAVGAVAVVFEVPFVVLVVVEGPVTTGCFPGLD